MAVCLQVTLPSATLEQYDAVMEHLDWDANPAPGALAHVAGAADGGLTVIDVWESREDFDRFFASRLQDAMAAAGMRAEPQIREFPVHRLYVGDPARA